MPYIKILSENTRHADMLSASSPGCFCRRGTSTFGTCPKQVCLQSCRDLGIHREGWVVTMCTISAVSLPWYLPSVARGLRSKKHAPASCAIACASMVLPLCRHPYSSTERAAASLLQHNSSSISKVNAQTPRSYIMCTNWCLEMCCKCSTSFTGIVQ